MPEPHELIDHPRRFLTPLQRRWLRPLGPARHAMQWLMFTGNRAFVRIYFRFQVCGGEHLPERRPYILAPNHTSSLDPLLLAAALDNRRLHHTHWAGRKDALLANKLRRRTNRLAQALPIDLSVRALAAGAAVLRAQEILVWFPEGHRTQDGQLQPFHFGVGALMVHLNVPAVPVSIDGAFHAMPTGNWIARPRSQVTVRFGPPVLPHQLPPVARDRDGYQQIADLLRDRLSQLQLPTSTAATAGCPDVDRSRRAER